VFELVALPVIAKAFAPYGVHIEIEERQTVYPDLTIVLEQETPNKIAIDIKSTYRRNVETAAFTLGAYTAYLRPPHTKNIRYPYLDYLEHWIVGFVYDRVPDVRAKIVPLENANLVVPPVENTEVIIQEKWRIASDRPGSGNTTNIGSVGDMGALRRGNGTFTRFGEYGEQVFEDYWRNFDRAVPRKYTNIDGYLEWRRGNPSPQRALMALLRNEQQL